MRRAEGLVAGAEDAVLVADHHVAGAAGEQQRDDRRARRAATGDHDPTSGELLLHAAQGVGQRGEYDDRGAVLVVVEDRDVEALAQPPLDLEAAWGGDVLEVDARRSPARSSRRPSRSRRCPGVARQIGQASMSANRLNSAALPSITGSAAPGPMLPSPSTAEPSVTTATELPLMVSATYVLGVVRQRQADPADARGVGHRQVVARAQRDLRVDLDLAADVEQEGAVADLVDLDALDLADRVDQDLGVVGVGGRAGDVDDEALVAGVGDVDRGDDAAGRGDGGGDGSRRPRGRARCAVAS